jgi:hypothetical protein
LFVRCCGRWPVKTGRGFGGGSESEDDDIVGDSDIIMMVGAPDA